MLHYNHIILRYSYKQGFFVTGVLSAASAADGDLSPEVSDEAAMTF